MGRWGDEGRGKPRKARGSGRRAMIPGRPNGVTHMPRGMYHSRESNSGMGQDCAK